MTDEDARQSSELWTHGYAQRPKRSRRPDGPGDVPDPVQDVSSRRHLNTEADGWVTEYPRFEGDTPVRTASDLSPLSPEWVAILRETCDNLCGLLRTLGGCGGSTGCGAIKYQVSGGGLGGLGLGAKFESGGVVGKVGTALFGSGVVGGLAADLCPGEADLLEEEYQSNGRHLGQLLKRQFRCDRWPECEECGPPRQ